MIRYMEKIKLRNPDTLNIPEAVMIRPSVVAVFDNIKDTINIMTAIYPNTKIDAKSSLDLANKKIKNVINRLNSEIIKNKDTDPKILKKNINFRSNYSKKEYIKYCKQIKIIHT